MSDVPTDVSGLASVIGAIWSTWFVAPVVWVFAKNSDVQELKTTVINTQMTVANMEGKIEVILSTLQRVEVNINTQHLSGDSKGNQVVNNDGEIV